VASGGCCRSVCKSPPKAKLLRTCVAATLIRRLRQLVLFYRIGQSGFVHITASALGTDVDVVTLSPNRNAGEPPARWQMIIPLTSGRSDWRANWHLGPSCDLIILRRGWRLWRQRCSSPANSSVIRDIAKYDRLVPTVTGARNSSAFRTLCRVSDSRTFWRIRCQDARADQTL
jgi:hypothetical protein